MRVLGLAGSTASALTLGGPVDGVAVDSFVFDHAGEVLREYVVAGAAREQAAAPSLAEADLRQAAHEPDEKEADGKTLSDAPQELLYYVSNVPAPLASELLSRTNTSEGADRMGNPAPEPSTGLLLLSSLGILARRNRRKRS